MRPKRENFKRTAAIEYNNGGIYYGQSMHEICSEKKIDEQIGLH